VLYRGLDTFRLLAFMAVFLYHVDMMEVGYLGVLAFFVLSGFLITPILVGMKRELVGHRFFLNFYGRRCLRIFPLYYLYLAVLGAGALLALSVEGLPKAIQQVDTQIVYALTYSYDFFHASRIFVQSPLLTDPTYVGCYPFQSNFTLKLKRSLSMFPPCHKWKVL